jgi:hypothetical protein
MKKGEYLLLKPSFSDKMRAFRMQDNWEWFCANRIQYNKPPAFSVQYEATIPASFRPSEASIADAMHLEPLQQTGANIASQDPSILEGDRTINAR